MARDSDAYDFQQAGRALVGRQEFGQSTQNAWKSLLIVQTPMQRNTSKAGIDRGGFTGVTYLINHFIKTASMGSSPDWEFFAGPIVNIHRNCPGWRPTAGS
jgi:hypothetical protein